MELCLGPHGWPSSRVSSRATALGPRVPHTQQDKWEYHMNNGVNPEKRAGKQRIATHIFRTRMNKGKPITMDEANELVDEVFDAMYLALANGFSVCVANFGSLTPVKRGEREGRNPQTGETVLIPAQMRVKWTAADRLVDVINGRSKVFTVRKNPKTKADA